MAATKADIEARRAARKAFVPSPPPVLFVGGTGRSGTHIASRLLGKSPHLALIPVECRFHTDDDGFPGLLAGEVSKERFLRRMRGYWWKSFQTNRIRGLHRFVPRERFDSALATFDSGFEADPRVACRRLFFDLLWPVAEEEDPPAAGVVEQSCDVVAQAPILVDVFPEARFVHIVRDGRDASASRVAQTRGLVYPRTRAQGIEWWEARIRRIDAGARAIPEDRFHELELGELSRGSRPALRALALHVGVRPDKRLKRFLRKKMSPETAHEARWRQGISARRQTEIDALYRDALARLEADGVSCAPLLRNAYERSNGG
jgi:hypothetical protein